jgi:hypothetical protein
LKKRIEGSNPSRFVGRFAGRGDRYVEQSPRKLGNEPDPDSTDPNDELPGQMDDVEHVEEDSEPLGGNFA